MTPLLIALGIITFAELTLWVSPLWKWRKAIACMLLVSLAIASGLLAGQRPALCSFLFAIVSIYRGINLLRIVEARMSGDYLYHVARRTSLVLLGLQILVLGFAALSTHYGWSAFVWWWLCAAAELLLALILFSSTRRHLKTTTPPERSDNYADRDLPTVTVAIPARNETDDLEACLHSLINNTYPKLEILVLDDCSQERRTPEIIRGLAHDGVRFIAGTVPPAHWLAKNNAYDQLAKEANGEILLFCGVDARFEPGSIRAIVQTMIQKKKSMISIMPKNQLQSGNSLKSLLFQPSRYAWELSLPRRWLNRPPVLSTCWVISQELLHKAGGFKAVSRSISPESFFARAAIRASDGYSFVQSDEQMGVSCQKSFSEQRATAVRMRYPQLHRRPEIAALLSLAELFVLVLPYLIAGFAAIHSQWGLAAVSLVSCTLLSAFYARMVSVTYRKFQYSGIWFLPFAAVVDVCVLNYSMWRYEFNEVVWKDRNICIPVMRVIPSLPKLP